MERGIGADSHANSTVIFTLVKYRLLRALHIVFSIHGTELIIMLIIQLSRILNLF